MSSIQERAKAELDRINFGEMDTAVMLAIMQMFFNRWDSGGAVSVAGPVLARLIEGKPLAPITGEWDEWIDRSELHGGTPMWQNMRCSSVFKTVNEAGEAYAYDIDAPGECVPIAFPYTPGEPQPRCPRNFDGSPTTIAEMDAAMGYHPPIAAGTMEDIETEMQRLMKEPDSIIWLRDGEPIPAFRNMQMRDPVMEALEVVRQGIVEQRRLTSQLAAQLEAEGEHTTAANAKIDEMLQAGRAK